MATTNQPVPAANVLWTSKQLAAWLHMDRKTLIARVNNEGWPHRRPGRQYLFSAEDRAEIFALIAVPRPRAS